MSTVVVHVSGGVADIVRTVKDTEVYVLDFDHYHEEPNMGSEEEKHRCPSCIETSTVFEWNAASMHQMGDNIIRFQKAKEIISGTFLVAPSYMYTCPRCFESSELKNILTMEEVKV